jgi:hypothetical protein
VEWISVKDRLPEIGQVVIMFTSLGVYIGCWEEGFVAREDGLYVGKKLPKLKGSLFLCCECRHWEEGGVVTHWMHLPKPPKD